MAKTCEHCGGDSVTHPIEYLNVCLGLLLNPLERFIPKFEVPGLWPFLVRVGAAKELLEPDTDTLLLDQMLWQEAKKRRIVMKEYRPLGSVRNSFTAATNGKTIEFTGVPYMQGAAWWVNNKSILKKRLSRLGMPVPQGSAAFSQQKALQIFESLTKPVVVKPVEGSASRHTTLHVTNAEMLVHAFAIAKRVSPLVSIEEELPGSVYRPTLVGGKLLAVLRRDQPYVLGNGTSTIEELVVKENINPKRHGPYFHPIRLDEAALEELAYQHLSPKSVPQTNQKVRLNQKINWALGGTTADVTDDVHPDNRKLFEDVARVLHAPLLGIDFIAEDIGVSWKEQRCGIIECNDMPYFDNHHLPYTGKPRDIAGPLWDLIISTSEGV